MKSFVISAILLQAYLALTTSKTIESTVDTLAVLDDSFDNNIIDSEEEFSVKFNKKYGAVPWHASDFKKHRYTIVNDLDIQVQKNKSDAFNKDVNLAENKSDVNINLEELTSTTDYSVIPLELLSTTENELIKLMESTTEPDLTVIPLSTTRRIPTVEIYPTVTLPSSTQDPDTTTDIDLITTESTTSTELVTTVKAKTTSLNTTNTTEYGSKLNITTKFKNVTDEPEKHLEITHKSNITLFDVNKTEEITNSRRKPFKIDEIEVLNTNSSKQIEVNRSDPINYELEEEDVPIFTELDTDDAPEVPDDYYDAKDVVPTSAPKTDALSVIFGLAGSVVESVAERVVPKTIFDLFKRMQKQNEALEAERLRSREENGGIGQFGRGILKTISTGLSKPLSQLMAGAGDAGSLDSDRGFVGSLASGVSSVANVATSVVDAFKDRVQAIYPGTVWCGDGRSATARSSDLGLFFFTDTCCRQHDACKLYIKAGDTKYGLTNTGLFTRSHCSCDAKFRDCLQRTNSLVSSQIGLTYFNVLGPQCFRRTHPIIRCVRRTRITGQKCEEYELDYTKPKMWQWFDNETF